MWGGGGGGGGGGHTYIVWGLVHAAHSCLCMYSTQRSRVRWGMLPQENLDHLRVLLRPLETTITNHTQHLWQLECNSGNSPCGCFSKPFLFEALPQNCLLGAGDLSLQDLSSDSYRDLC